MPAQVRLFRCLQDNFGVLVHDPASGATAAIDAPEAAPVEAALKGNGWKLTDILVTHHHGDHTGGIAELKQRYRCRVVAPHGEATKIPQVDLAVKEGETVKVGTLSAHVLETPGHTLGHIAYWFEADTVAFVADAIFALGCGRVFEGTFEQMWNSLAKLKERLPDDTVLYCAHEYTQSNARFALTIEPGNAALVARVREIDELRARGLPTVPTVMALEKATNPFLRPDSAEVQRTVGLVGAPLAEVFAEVRKRKDNF